MRKPLLIASLLALASIPIYAIAADDHHATVQSDGLEMVGSGGLRARALRSRWSRATRPRKACTSFV